MTVDTSAAPSPSTPWPSGLTLLRWAIFDPLLLQASFKELIRWQRRSLLLKAYLWVVAPVLLLYAIGIAAHHYIRTSSAVPKSLSARHRSDFSECCRGVDTDCL